MGQDYGAPDIDYDRFSARWDDTQEGPLLRQLVDRYDDRGLVIKTKKSSKPAQAQGNAKSGTPEMDKAVKRELAK